MIDTHAHLDFPEFNEDREEVIRRAFNNGINKIINVGVDSERSRKSIEIAEKHKEAFASVGLHPDWFTKRETPNQNKVWYGASTKQDIDELRELARNNKVVAIGETGLDYFSHDNIPIADRQKENQKEGFVAQINLARELDLPVIAHCREAWEDLYKIISNFFKSSASLSSKVRPFPPALREERGSSKPNFTKFVLHCYSGERKDTEKFLELPNVYFSFSGNITYPKPADRAGKLAEAIRMIPLDKIMLDSDAPFLAPQSMRGKRNEPSYIKYIAEKIASIKEISASEVEKATDENALRFFGLG